MKDKLNNLKSFIIKNKLVVSIVSAVILVVLLAVILLVSCSGGGDEPGEESSTNGDSNAGNTTYNIEVKSEGGVTFSEIGVYIYEDSTLQELVAFQKTDESGKMSFEAENVDGYVAVLQGIPEGYNLQESYPITGENTQIVLKTELLPLEDMENTTFDLGDVIKDFSVTTPDGTKLTITELLAEKKAVVLNFFYLGCQPCMSEFPYLEEAYSQYSEDIAVIAMTPVDKDDAAIKARQEELGLTFYMAQCDSLWEKMMEITAYPTTVVIDRYGIISLIHKGSVTETETFNGVFEYFTADSYKQGTVKYVEDIINYEGEEGTAENPIDLLPDAEGFDAKVAAGAEVYYEIPKVTNLVLRIEDTDVYIKYNDETYKPVDGVLTVTISAPDTYTPAVFVVGNSGSAEKTFKATFSAIEGSMVNPFTMNIGEFTVNVEAGNEQGVYYTYTATENGTLTLQCLSSSVGEKYDFTLYNLNTYANRNLSSDGENATVSIDVNSGDVVQFSVAALPDENNEYPAGEFKFKAVHAAGEGTTTGNNDGEVTYSVKVTDSNGKALKGITVNIDSKELTTDSNGMVTTMLKAGSYIVGVVVPEGFKVQGEVTVSKDSPNATVVLVSTTAKQITYTVKVTDESGNAISGATVIVGSSVSTTNASGVATFSLAEGKYDVTASANGYGAGSASVTTSTSSITIKLKKSQNVSSAVSYTVNVTNYKNEALSGVTVIFKSNETAVATATTDGSGKATAKLASGNYDIVLAYDGYGFDCNGAKVTASQTSVTLTMAEKATSVEEVYFDATGAYTITTGAKYVDVPSEDTKNNEGKNAYFLFEPRKAGTYEISVSNPSALLSYWGGSTSYINDATYDIKHTNTSLTLNVVEAGPTFVIGIQGVQGCIVTVTRTGNAVTEMAWTDYVATDTVSPYTFGSGTLTYVDITKTGDNPYNLVYNSADGYYHVGSANGPVMLVHLGAGAPYISLSDVIGFTGSGGSNFGKYIYDSKGTLIKKENYTSLLWKYMENMDENKYVYPLTKDLEHILKNGGEYRGWWATSGYGNTIYSAVPNLNPKIAWMWACCYVAQ